MTIPQKHVDHLLSMCGRHCCLCRRFKPLHLQVHHIKPVSEGGLDEPDNLIAICVSCHIDVHANVPFTRRFTENELKQCRDHVIDLVENGTLPSVTPVVVQEQFVAAETTVTDLVLNLSSAAAELLVNACRQTHPIISKLTTFGGGTIQAGKVSIEERLIGPREYRRYAAGLEQLLDHGLVSAVGYKGEIFDVTYEGYAWADEIEAYQSSSQS